MSATAAAAITAGSALVGGASNAVIGAKLNKKNRDFYREMTEKQNQFNADQAQLAYQRQRELYDYQFDKESVYNDPRAQMQRMRAAGLNPALLYGSGVGDAGSVSAAPSGVGSASAANANPPEMQNYLTPAIESLSTVAQALSDINLKSSTSEKTKADTDLSRANSRKVTKEAETLSYQLEKMLPVQHRQLLAELKRTIQDMKDSHQVSTAQVKVLQNTASEILSKVKLNEHTDSKLVKELERYQEYINNVYDRESIHKDADKLDLEWQDATKGLKTRIMQHLQHPFDNPSALFQDVILYYLMRTMKM